MAVLQFIQNWYRSLRARLEKKYRIRDITKTLLIAHSAELAHTPIEEWALVKERQAREILAVTEGKIDIVDRRSWVFPYLPETLHRLKQPIIKNCFSSDTEILTKRGWIFVTEMQKDDNFASRDKKGHFVWIQAKKIFKYRYKGVMLHFNTKGVDMLVSPDHRMLGRNVSFKHGKFEYSHEHFSFAKDVTDIPRIGNAFGFQIPLSSEGWAGDIPKKTHLVFKDLNPNKTGRKAVDFIINVRDYVALVGLYLAEGTSAGALDGVDYDSKISFADQSRKLGTNNDYVLPEGRRGEGYYIHIAQKPYSKDYEKIKKFLLRLGFYESKQEGFRITSKALWQNLHPLGNTYTKHIPRWVMELPEEYLRSLIEWYCVGDGHKSRTTKKGRSKLNLRNISCPDRWFMLATASKNLADDLSEILQKLGYGNYVYFDKPHKLKSGRKSAGLYRVHKANLDWVGIGEAEEIDYNGYIYCPALPPYETLYVRRNGKAAWCGNTPYNVRRFSRTPVPRRAINLIKNAITALEWDIVPKKGTAGEIDDDLKQRCEIAKKCFLNPNNTESFLQFQEQGIDDMCVNGAFVIEPQITPNPDRPFKMWTVDSSTIRIYADWKESTMDQPHYAQMTGLKGERGIIVFYDDELIYMKDNPQVDSPFGMGKMEVGFAAINSFLGVQEMSGRAGSDQIHKSWLWWEQSVSPSHMDIVRRHIMNDLEGQAKVSLMSGMKAPTVIDVQALTVDDLLLEWQEMLIRMIANAFDMSAMALNLERDINRSTGEVLDDRDFRSSVVPMATRLQEGFTRGLLHRLLGWKDVEFKYLNMDDPDAETKMVINQQLYATNAITPQEIRVSMGKPESASPFAGLTQGEFMLVMTEAQSVLQNQQAEAQFGRQQTTTNQQFGMQQNQLLGPNQPKAGKPPSATQASGVSAYQAAREYLRIMAGLLPDPKSSLIKLKLPKMPKTAKPMRTPGMKMLNMPKMPIAGSIYNAEDIAGMSMGEYIMAQNMGQISQDNDFVSDQMQQQDPDILQKMSQELVDYFEYTKQLQQEKDSDESIEVTPEMEQEQKDRFKKWQHEPPEIEVVVNKGTEKTNKPPIMKKRIKPSSHGFGSPNTKKAFKRPNKKDFQDPASKRSGGANTGMGVEQDHNPPYQKPKPKKKIVSPRYGRSF